MELERYLVELERPPDGWAQLEQVAAGARAAAAAMCVAGVPVRFLRSIFVPEDDACFFLFEAPSQPAVKEAVERAAATPSAIREATRLHTESS